AGDFITSHIEWVRERLHNIPEAQPFHDGAVIPLRGTPHLVRFVGRQRGRGIASLTRTVDGNPAIDVYGDAEFAPRRLRDWLIATARQDLEIAVARHAGRLGLTPKRITVRDQVSRWGSCSSTGNLSFSWRLIMAPPAILDYVAAHEVAHLREMNHGPNFWDLVRETYPDLDDAKDWLDVFGLDLHRYGAHS
ncbi:MAG: SprT family zinc-dependent metalloprotease, partial [Pseudomonadota bacterium]